MKREWLTGLLLLAGCSALPPAPFRAAESHQALANWRHGSESLTAEVVFQKDASGTKRLVVSKGRILLALAQTEDGWAATGPLARGGWRGKRENAPAPLAGWICLAETWNGQVSAFGVRCTPDNRFRVVFSD